ncbi:unnamed protein product [Discosporangium mesarthrocarpum]
MPASVQTAASLEADLDIRPVVKFLQNALNMKLKGDALHYQHLVDQLLSRDDPETLWRLYVGLSLCVTTISQSPEEFDKLIDAVFRFNWTGSQQIIEAFSGLLISLISANGTYIVPAMHQLMRNLVGTVRDLDENGKVSREGKLRQEHIHRVLEASLSLVPSGCSKLFSIISARYPFRRVSAELLANYAHQALRIIKYAPLLEEKVVRLIIERSLEIDVEIKIMDSGDAVVDEDEGALFAIDDLTHGKPKMNSMNEQVDEMAERLDGVMVVLFGYLDHRLAGEAQAWFSRAGYQPNDMPAGSENAEEGKREGEGAGGVEGHQGVRQRVETVGKVGSSSLLVVFGDVVLPTHRSKFVQFVVFFICARASWMSSALCSKLLDTLHEPSTPKLIQQSSVAYLASYLARASFVKGEALSRPLSGLLEWAQAYLEEHEGADVAGVGNIGLEGTPGRGEAQTPLPFDPKPSRPGSWHNARARSRTRGVTRGVMSVTRSASASKVLPHPQSFTSPGSACSAWRVGGGEEHRLFYSVCQASFYIMCFRGEELAKLGAIKEQAAAWGRVLSSPLNPLRYCLDTVRKEFARLCCHYFSENLQPSLLDHLWEVTEEGRHGKGAQILVGSSLAPSALLGSITPLKPPTKAGGLGCGSNPLDSFFPFDPYLLRRSHVYIGSTYNMWKAHKDNIPPAEEMRRSPSKRRSRPLGLGLGLESNSSSGSDTDDSSSSSSDLEGAQSGEEQHGLSQMDDQSFSMRQTAAGLLSRARLGHRFGSIGDGDSEELAVSQKMASSYISEMSVTPNSSVGEVGSMGGCIMATSHTDDVRWGGAFDEACFHEDVPLSSSQS